MPQASRAIANHDRPCARLDPRALVDAGDDAEHRYELDHADGHRPVEERVRVAAALPHGQSRGSIAEQVAERREEPEQPGCQSDLLGRDQIRHVALERSLGEVGAELEEGDEGSDGGNAVRRRDAVQKDDVERRPDEDVGLAPAPASDRVVADRADGRLDDDGDDRPDQGDLKSADPLGALLGETGELEPAVDDVEDAAPDRRDAQPVERDPHQLGQRELPSGAAVPRRAWAADRLGPATRRRSILIPWRRRAPACASDSRPDPFTPSPPGARLGFDRSDWLQYGASIAGCRHVREPTPVRSAAVRLSRNLVVAMNPANLPWRRVGRMDGSRPG